MHICVRKLTIIGSDNGLSPGRCQVIIWTNVGILLMRTLGRNFSEILSEIYTFSFKKMHFKMSSAKWQQFCLGLNVLILVSQHMWQRSIIKLLNDASSILNRKKIRVCFLPAIWGHVRMVLANERRRYICNVFSHWLRLFSCDLMKKVENGPKLWEIGLNLSQYNAVWVGLLYYYKLYLTITLTHQRQIYLYHTYF